MNDREFQDRLYVMDQWAESVRTELVSVILDGRRLPDILYHYTDLNGLIGLVSSGCIWATHANRLNDASENRHGFNFVMEHVRANLLDSSRPFFEKVLSELESEDTYIACYSTKNDLLSQWCSYCRTGVGYSLGFDAHQMATLDDKMPLLERVIYNEAEAKAALDLLLKRVEEFFNQYSFSEVEIGYFMEMVRAYLNIIACIIKHPKFEEESEWRHFYQLSQTSLMLEPFFRNGRFGLTPYVKIEFLEKGKLPLKTITIGPCQDFDLESNALKILLGRYGYKQVEIFHSEIPLRV